MKREELDRVLQWCPQMADELERLDDFHLERLGLAFPLGGHRPFFGVEARGSIVPSADPKMVAILRRMDELLWKHAREECERVMRMTRWTDLDKWANMVLKNEMREKYTPRNSGPTDDLLIDVEAHEVGDTIQEDRRLI